MCLASVREKLRVDMAAVDRCTLCKLSGMFLVVLKGSEARIQSIERQVNVSHSERQFTIATNRQHLRRHAILYETCAYWYKRFKSGDFDLSDRPRHEQLPRLFEYAQSLALLDKKSQCRRNKNLQIS
uniref:HTH CENPB-type domain-containing protein n=1 Tax=Mesocestoides corti TaxID=53468 RepID=A0A5K3EWU0_MESCO